MSNPEDNPYDDEINGVRSHLLTPEQKETLARSADNSLSLNFNDVMKKQYDNLNLFPDAPELTPQERSVLTEVQEYLTNKYPNLMFEARPLHRGVSIYLTPVKIAGHKNTGNGV